MLTAISVFLVLANVGKMYILSEKAGYYTGDEKKCTSRGQQLYPVLRKTGEMGVRNKKVRSTGQCGDRVWPIHLYFILIVPVQYRTVHYMVML
jgi:hypothetical protein